MSGLDDLLFLAAKELDARLSVEVVINGTWEDYAGFVPGKGRTTVRGRLRAVSPKPILGLSTKPLEFEIIRSDGKSWTFYNSDIQKVSVTWQSTLTDAMRARFNE